MSSIVTLNQDTDTPARREITPAAVLTYLYDRSRDSKNSSGPGQDFIAFSYDEYRIAFAVCDGVSQSFYGDLAARFLGEKLVAWFCDTWMENQSGNLAEQLDKALRSWTDEATRLVKAKAPNPNLPPMIRDALERKRDNGSESMFVAGLVDFEQKHLAVGWMGDMRLWLWDASYEPVDLPDAVWNTKERWSSRLGPKNGTPHTAILPLDNIARITVHSDGVGSRAPELQMITLEELDQLAQDLSATPTSDDVSVLEITLETVDAEPLSVPTPHIPDPQEPVLKWEPIDGADWYRVEVRAQDHQWTVDVSNTTFFLPSDLTGAVCRVQALASYRQPGEWSEPITVGRLAAPVVEAAPAVESAVSTEPAPVVEVEPVVTASRPFGYGVIMASALLLALLMAVGWYLLNIR